MKKSCFPFPIRLLGLVLLTSVIVRGGALQAQSTNSSAAPDSGTAPAATDNLVSNGDFSTAANDPTWPDGWKKAKGITWETEDGKHFLRLVAQEPGKVLMAYQEVKIPTGVTSLDVSIRFRTDGVAPGDQNWMDARTIFHFLDANRKPVTPDPGVLDFPNATAEWTVLTKKITVPDGATILVLMPSLFKVTGGTLDLAEIRVVPSSQ